MKKSALIALLFLIAVGRTMVAILENTRSSREQ